jgi:predicted regulator of Ras-like GTPase activity (Roadblock/LC7/MglB family)
MLDLATIVRLPQVKSAVLSDPAGGLRDVIGNVDGEAVAAVTGYLTGALAETGERLGLGPLLSISFAGGERAALVVVQGDVVLTTIIEPAAALSTVERSVGTLGGEP